MTTMDFDPDTHPVRITTHGKIKTWVQFALDFLDVRHFLSHRFSCSIPIGQRGAFANFPYSATPRDPTKWKRVRRHHPSPHLRGRNRQARTFGATQGKKEFLPCWCPPIQRGRCAAGSPFAAPTLSGRNGDTVRLKVRSFLHFSPRFTLIVPTVSESRRRFS